VGAYLIGCFFGLSYFELKMQEKYPELKNTLFQILYERLRHSRIISIIVAAVGIGLTAMYVFPLQGAYN